VPVFALYLKFITFPALALVGEGVWNDPLIVNVVIAPSKDIPHVIPSDTGLPSVSVVGMTSVSDGCVPLIRFIVVDRLADEVVITL
jgi:hypothetical protein